jgi:hypothetical protein
MLDNCCSYRLLMQVKRQGLGEEVLAMSSQLKTQQCELESSRQVLQGMQGVVVASLEAE